MGNVLGISTRIKSKAPMELFSSAKVSFNHGVGDDSRGLKRNGRQITIMSKEAWEDALSDLGQDLHWTTRRANILVEGIDLENTTGEILKVGSFLVEITGELNPCHRMDEQAAGLTKALTPNWRGGVTCKLLREGIVNENDSVTFVDKNSLIPEGFS
jgi:MOSC domain-containing protein YiiM